MKKQILLSCALCWAVMAGAETIDITTFRYAGPYAVHAPFQIDSVDVNSKNFVVERLLDVPLSMDALQQGTTVKGELLPGSDSDYALHLVSFVLENTHYTTAKLKIEGLKNYQLYVDGEKHEGTDLVLEPATHRMVIKYLSESGKKESLRVSLDAENEEYISFKQDNQRLYTLADVLHGTRFTGAELSPNGKYLITNYQTTRVGGQSSRSTRITELATGKVLAERSENIQWMPRSNRYYYTRTGVDGKQLLVVDPATGVQTVWVDQLPDGYFQFAPTEDYLLFTLIQEGPKERKEIYEILEPEDRQPGWRNRSYLAKYDLKTGLLQPLTFGYHNVSAVDISNDGRYILMMTTQSRLTQRPTTLFSLYRLDVQTLQAELLIDKDGFISGAHFSPDGTQVLLSGSPESLNGIGKNVKKGQTPSMTDQQLYVMNIADKKVTPLTKYFNPNVQRVVWNESDGKIYFTAENRDYYSLYQMNPEDGKIQQLEVPEDLVNSFSLAKDAPVMVYYGQSTSNSDRLYTLNTKNLKSSLVEDLSKDILKDVELGECKAWSFTNSRGILFMDVFIFLLILMQRRNIL